MDWTQIITLLITALVPTGGLVAIFTVREKKTEMMLDNANKVISQWQSFAEKEEERRKELKEDLDRKDKKIESLYDENKSLKEKIDDAHTDVAIARLLICDKLGCMKRRPPFGQGRNYDLSCVAYEQQMILSQKEAQTDDTDE